MPCDGDSIERDWEALVGALQARIERGVASLELLRQSTPSRTEVIRIKAKRDGLRLAESYLEELLRAH